MEFSLEDWLLIRRQGAQAGMGVLCAPIAHGCLRNLDVVLIKFSPLFERAEDLLAQPSASSVGLQLERDCLAVDAEFMAWGNSQCDIWAPKVAGLVRTEAAKASGCAYVCAGQVDKYFDCGLPPLCS